MKHNLQRNLRSLNLHICSPEWVVENELPSVKDVSDFVPEGVIAFSKSLKSKDFNMGIHFFEDDRYFERVWTHPERYVCHLKKFQFVISPDFSIYKNAPNPVKEWNLYRSRLLSRYWQENGIKVIPTVPFGGFDFNHYAMIGLQEGGTVAISTVGSLKKNTSRIDFQTGLDVMCKNLRPRRILVYGITDGFDFHEVPVSSFSSYSIHKSNKRERYGIK